MKKIVNITPSFFDNALYKFGHDVRKIFLNSLYFFFRKSVETNTYKKAGRIALEITNACNANCSFCAYRYQERPVSIMSNEKFSDFLKKYIEYGGGELKFTPLVGDPLVDKNIIEKIKLARSFKEITYIYTYTNGIGFDRLNIRDFLESGINEISISTCIGGKEMYKKLFGVDKYEVVVENIKELLTVNNKLKNKVKISLSIRGDKPYEIIHSNKDYKEILKLYGRPIHILDDGYDNWAGLIKKKDLPIGQKWRKISPRKKKEPCSQLYKGLYVQGDGDVNACWSRDMEATLNVGNIFKESFDNIWKGNKLKALRNNWKKGDLPEVCKKCNQYTSLTDYLKNDSFRILKNSIKKTKY